MHRPKDKESKDIATTNQDEKEHNKKLEITKEQYIFSILIAIISIGIGYFGNLLANYSFLLWKDYSFLGGFLIAFIIFIVFIGSLLILAYEKLYPKN